MTVLECSGLCLEVRGGRLVRFVVDGDNWLKGAKVPDPLTRLSLALPDNTRVEAWPVDATVTSDGTAARFSSHRVQTADLQEFDVHVVLEVALRERSAVWMLAVENADPGVVVEQVWLPCVSGLRLGGAWQDDELIMPFHAGERLSPAVTALADLGSGKLSGLERGRDRVRQVGDRYEYELTYAGDASMTWLAVVDPGGALYVASHDPAFPVTVLHADTAVDQADAINVSLRTWVSIVPGEIWTSGEVVTAAVDGGWHGCAERYRAWIDSVLIAEVVPDAWRERHALWVTVLMGQDGRTALRFEDLPGRYGEVRESGVNGLCLYGWSLGGFDTRYPEFYPDLHLGGPNALASAIDAVHDLGGWVMTYLNGRIMNLASPYLPTLGQSWGVRAADGSLVTETYGTQEFAVMCPGAPGWTALLVDLGRSLVTQFGTDMVYYDQVSSARPVRCHAEDHEHDSPGMWNRHYLAMLAAAQAAFRAERSDVALYVEGCGDLYAGVAPFQEDLTLFNGGSRFGFPELFRYAFPEVHIVDVVHNITDPRDAVFRLPESVPGDLALWHLQRGVLHGHFLTPLPSVAADAEWFNQVSALLRLAAAARPWLARASFRDDRGLLACPEHVRVKTYQGEDFLVIGILTKAEGAGGEVTVAAGSMTIVSAETLTVAGRAPIEVQQHGERVTVPVPSQALSFTLLRAAA